MQNKNAKFWIFECGKCKGKRVFESRLLINDEIWSVRDHFAARRHEKNHCSGVLIPYFVLFDVNIPHSRISDSILPKNPNNSLIAPVCLEANQGFRETAAARTQ
jgi:hypothetical protein